MKIRDVIVESSKRLGGHLANLESRVLLTHLMNITIEDLILRYNNDLEPALIKNFNDLIERRKTGEPIAYITGKKEFYGYEFNVNKKVLIPRPETEIIIDFILQDTKNNFQDEEINILDLGTGSGAISIALSKELKKKSKITAVDMSSEALEVALSNAIKHGVETQIEFLESNWYDDIPVKKYDYIISNPPYISKDKKERVAEETALFEPDLALYSENNGLESYEKIIFSSSHYLQEDGKLVLEIGYDQKESVTNILKENSFKIFDIKQDLSSLDRVIIAIKQL